LGALAGTAPAKMPLYRYDERPAGKSTTWRRLFSAFL